MKVTPNVIEYLPAWGNNVANRVRGTDATQYARHIDSYRMQDGNIYVTAFITQLYRSAVLVNYNSLETDIDGVTALRFVLGEMEMETSTENPDNIPYYMDLAYACLNLSSVYDQVPLILTKPFFLDIVEPSILSNVVFPGPANRDIHDTVIDVEPFSGIVVHAAKRLQINFLLPNSSIAVGNKNYLPILDHFQGITLFPLAWLDENGKLTHDQAVQFTDQVYVAQSVLRVIKWTGFGIGIFFTILSFVLLVLAIRKAHRHHLEIAPSLNDHAGDLNEQDYKYDTYII
jgi:lysosome membrane protein 2